MPRARRKGFRRSGLDVSEDDLRRMRDLVADLLAGWRAGRRTAPILPPRGGRGAWRTFLTPLPRRGQDLARLQRHLGQVLALSRRNDSPRFWGYVNPPGTEIGALADWLASGINQNLSSWRSAPGATLVELQVIEWIRRLVGMPRGTVGLFTSGGSLANLTALAAAREAAFSVDLARHGLVKAGGEQLVLYASEETHHSIQKAAALLGIGTDGVRLVPTDRRLRLDVAALRRALGRDRQAGRRPFCVVANAGTVVSGAVDPLETIADLCRRARLWMHVDASYGGFAVLTRTGRRLLRGIGRADSIALDPHKWLYAPHDAGCVLYRDPRPARRAFRLGADYIRTFGSSRLEQFAFWDYGPELSRRFRALKIWLTFKYHGAAALAEAIEKDLCLARRLAERVRAAPRLELLSRGDLSIVCFRYVPAGPPLAEAGLERLNHAILVALQREGRFFLTNARVRGRFALRACFLNYRTTESDLNDLVRRVLTVGRAQRPRPGRAGAVAG